MKISLISFLSLLCATKPSQAHSASKLIFDINNPSILPKHFRSLKANLNIAGGSQFTAEQLKGIVNVLEKPLIIVDLRQESHGFVNGAPISWYSDKDWGNVHLNDSQVFLEEKKRLASLSGTVMINKVLRKDDTDTIIFSKKIPMKIKEVSSEQELVEKAGLQYQRFFITDHRAPNVLEVNRFVNFVKALPPHVHLYFHCHAGIGRTSTFMVMYDILRNAKENSLNDILKRQYLSGGKDLREMADPHSYKYIYHLQRYRFIQAFYEYARANDDHFVTSWSEWEKSHKN